MKHERTIIHITTETTPFYKRGGLGDVVGALPHYLENEHTHNIVICPFYDGKMKCLEDALLMHDRIRFRDIPYDFHFHYLRHNSVEYYFIQLSDSILLSERENNDGSSPYSAPVSIVPYFYFARAALHLIDRRQLAPDYLICHDWHTGGCFGFTGLLDNIKKNKPFRSLFIIHNYEFQGSIYEDIYDYIDCDVKIQLNEIFSRYGHASLLSLALKNSDYIATVSHSYAQELADGRVPHTGLKHLELCNRQVLSFLNGIDPLLWRPETSPFLPHSYTLETFERKKDLKKYVLQSYGFEKPNQTDAPLILMLCRLTVQKGIELFTSTHGGVNFNLKNMSDLLALGCRFIICGNPGGGLKNIIDTSLSVLQKEFQGKFLYINNYNEAEAHLLLAAADILLAPSLFEPCGLIQVYAMAFGTVPVVHPVGGMKDTVCCYFENPGTATGFYMKYFNRDCLRDTLQKTIRLYYQEPKTWQEIITRGMKVDFSWERMRNQYFRFFELIEKGNSVDHDTLARYIKDY
ncbi:MAG: glycogen/starch synthase [Acidobacteria bacterium]|jgi:starch synthase|nr:glycogen/starch synthase [Acidobacteriota bacterium]